MRGRLVILLSILSIFGILFMLNYTTPLEAGVFGILIFFIMVFMFFFGVMFEIVKIIQRMSGDLRGKKNVEVGKRTYMYATIAAFGPIMLLVIRTFSSVNLFTFMLVLLFVFLSCFLVYKRA